MPDNADLASVIYRCLGCGQKWKWNPNFLMVEVEQGGQLTQPVCPACGWHLAHIGSSEPDDADIPGWKL